MKEIKKGQVNNFITTVSELVTLENPNFLFCIYSSEENCEGCFILNNFALSCRFDSFEFDEPNDFEFNQAGFYTYKIFEQEDDINLDPELSTSLVEEGRIEVVEIVTEKEYISDEKRKVYNG